ncbi:MAG: antibiotic biosynthesis monooxygenase [Flavobacteriales bacterium]|nr:antibiotic biosynthesis monooxygenase [Flavobacteriales bacterium]MDG1781210.1 antibiotic biosynthesis monooxygenase [Flavobacteriales bacterium]MDG2245755.1 antibiotic biosynthesis monooxygenase [Flavobacteriales bacterium]
MVVRIVRMTFRKEEIETFLATFEIYKEAIRQQPGCTHLKLIQDVHRPEVCCTYSHWDTEEDLNNYRYSATFKEVWPLTKALFAAKPEAWSSHVVDEQS